MKGQVQKGKIVLVPFPFTDMTETKIRPALVLHVGKRDATVAFISSKVPNFAGETEVIINAHSPSFYETGLNDASVIKLDKITTIDKSLIYGELGEIGDVSIQSSDRPALAAPGGDSGPRTPPLASGRPPVLFPRRSHCIT